MVPKVGWCCLLIGACLLAWRWPTRVMGYDGRFLRYSEEAVESAVQTAVQRGVTFLSQQQLSTGEFPVEVLMPTYAWRADSTPFGTALLLYSLARVPDSRTAQLIARAADFVQSHENAAGQWSYWASQPAQRDLLPTDADDTAVAAVGLLLHGRQVRIRVEALAPYRDAQGRVLTWLIDRNQIDRSRLLPHVARSLDDPDCVVNAHVLGLSAWQQVTDERLCAWIVDRVSAGAGQSCSAFYTTPYALGYAAMKARALGAACLDQLEPVLQQQLMASQQLTGSWGSVLDTALALTTAAHVRLPSDRQQRAVRFLLARQRRDGSWPREVCYVGLQSDPTSFQFGSAALTTGLVLEALSVSRPASASQGAR